jgi:hypothetical protein
MRRARFLPLRRLIAVPALGFLLCGSALSCARGGRLAEPVPEPNPFHLERRHDRKLRSKALDVSLRYLEADRRRPLFAVFRLSNRTRAPIYPLLNEILLEKPGAEPAKLKAACDRERRPRPRLAPREVLWCASFANPGYSIDVPLALDERPAGDGLLRFDLVMPVVFDEGEPVQVRFGNRVKEGDWELTLSTD